MLKSSDIAKELHVSEQTVRAYARDGLIPFVETPGGHRRYVLEDVLTALSRAKPREFAPLGEDDAPRLTQQAPGAPLRRGRSRSRGITPASIADARNAGAHTVAIPFIGVQGSSRFVVGQRAGV
jgi:hypothetical protein